MVSQAYLKTIPANVKLAYAVADGAVDALSAGSFGLGGISASASLSHLARQLKFISKYNPEVLGLKKGQTITDALKTMRAGDVVVYGDPTSGGPSAINKIPGYYAGSGGMGGFDEHAVYLQQLNDRYGKGGAKGLRAITPTEQTDTEGLKYLRKIFGDDYRPKTYSPRVKALEAAVKRSLLKSQGRGEHFKAITSFPGEYRKQRDKIMRRQGSPNYRTGQISKKQHERILRNPALATRTADYFVGGPEYGPEYSAPFSVLRPEEVDLDMNSKRLRNIAKDTISEGDMMLASAKRRIMPAWLTEGVDKARRYLNPRLSNQAPTCAGGSCYVATGKGRTLLPSDLRYSKGFQPAKDYLPADYLKATTGERSVGKGIKKLKSNMRLGAIRSSMPGLLFSGGMTGLGLAPRLMLGGAAKQVPKFNLNQFVTDKLSKFK